MRAVESTPTGVRTGPRFAPAQERKIVAGVPYLSDIPVVGLLLRRGEQNTDSKSAVATGRAADVAPRIAPNVFPFVAPRVARLAERTTAVRTSELRDYAIPTASRARSLRTGTKTVIRNTTAIIHADGTVEIQGGTVGSKTTKTVKPKTTSRTKKPSR